MDSDRRDRGRGSAGEMLTMRKMRKMNATVLYLVLTITVAFLEGMIFTVSSVYLVTMVGLSPLQLVLVGSVLEATAFLGEVPTGVVADVYSRRLSMVIGYVVMGCGFILQGAVPQFGALLVAQVVWGLGYTFTSGATEAWLVDEIGQEQAGQAFLRATQLSSLAVLLGIGGGTLLAQVGGLQLPIVLGGAGLIALAAGLALVMPEQHFTPTSRADHTTWQTMIHTTRSGWRVVRSRPVLFTLLVVGMINGAFSEGVDRLWTIHLIQNLTLPQAFGWQPIVWIGLIRAAWLILSIAAAEVVRRRLDMRSDRAIARTLWWMTAGIVAGVLGLALAPSFALGVIALVAIMMLRRTMGPILSIWTNQHIGTADAGVRATVLSMVNQADAMGQIAGGPVVGAVGNFSLRLALTMSALILTPALALYRRTRLPPSQV